MKSYARRCAPLVILAALVLSLAPTASAEEGWATWYGPGFDGKRMASGGIYDQNDPTTTASNQYPFGTWLKVTSLSTGRVVYVQVRDRGGFSHALDLSYAAFKAIDDPSKMLTHVRYEVVSGPGAEPAPPATPKPQPTPVPTPTPQRPEPSSRSGQVETPDRYVVQPGETLWSIAQRYGVSVADLQRANGLDRPESLRVGQELALKGKSAAPVQAPAPASAASGRHVVQPGETLWGIATRYGVSADALQAANGLERPENLQVGQVLTIGGAAAPAQAPAPAPAAKTVHTVAAGETLWGIAVSYDVDVEALAAANGLDVDGVLSLGQELTIPGSAAGSAPAAPAPVREYVVQPGDSLFGIAQRSGVDADELARLNGLDDPSLIQPGDKLKLP